MRAARSAAVLAGALVAAGVLPAAPGLAAPWSGRSVVGTGTLTMVNWGHAFTALDAGTGGDTYSTGAVLSLAQTRYVDLTNRSTSSAKLSGTVVLRTFLGNPALSIDLCSQAWTAGSCGGRETVLLARTVVTAARPVTWTPSALGAGEVAHLRFVLGGSVSNGFTATASVTPGRGAMDRTRG